MRTSPIAAMIFSLAFSAAAGSQRPGMSPLTTSGERALAGHVMYPATDGWVEPFAGSAVWRGTTVQTGAAPTDGVKPLVILSHGVWGNRYNQVWLAERLVEDGYIVLALDHPGTSTWDRNPLEGARLWEMPRDLTRFLDAFLNAPEWAAMVDPSQIYAVGHSLGGYTVLAAAGARFNSDRLSQFCQTKPYAIACTVFAQLGVRDDQAAALSADLSDPRLSGVIALDPSGVPALSPESLTSAKPIAVIRAGRTPEILNSTYEADALAMMGEIEHVALEEAGHFDFLGVCTDQGIHILRNDNPETVIICVEGQTPCADLHNVMATEVIRLLGDFAKR